MRMKYKLFYGLWMCSSDGVLSTPSGMYSVKLPKWLAFKIHTFINKFAFGGKADDIMLLGIIPSYPLCYDFIEHQSVYVRVEHLYLCGKPIKKTKDYSEIHQIRIRILCRLKKL